MRFHSLDEGFKGSGHLTETLLDPELGHSYEVNTTPFNRAHNVNVGLWTWFEAPENRLRLARFGAAMNGAKNMNPPEAILEGPVTLRGSCITVFDTSNSQGTPGDSSLRARSSSMLEAVLAHSPWCSPTITRTFVSLFKTANQSFEMQSRYVHCNLAPRSMICIRQYDLPHSTGRRTCPTQSNPAA